MTHHKFDIISGGNKNKEKCKKLSLLTIFVMNQRKTYTD